MITTQVKHTVTDRARPLIDDTATAVADQDWSDARLLRYYNDIVRLIMSLRPDVRIDDGGNEIVFVAATDVVDDNRKLDDKWMQCEAHGMAWRAFSDDEGDTRDMDRAESNYEDFSRLINSL